MKILFAAANPVETDPLRLDRELREIQTKIRAADDRADFDIRSVWALRPDDLLQQLNEFRPNIVHFSGHGSTSDEIILEGEDGRSRPVSKQTLKALFENFREHLYVVVLNACYSESQAETLLEAVAVVVGMDGAVGDQAAISFSASFYRALAFNRSIHDAFQQGLVSIQLAGLVGQEKIPALRHNASIDPRDLTIGTLPTTLLAQRYAADPRVPESIRTLLHEGTELIIASGEADPAADTAGGSTALLLELRMRQSSAVFVVEVGRETRIDRAATMLARKLVPASEWVNYDWSLVSDGAILPDFHTFRMAGLRSGTKVLLVGNHRLPTWAPYPAGR